MKTRHVWIIALAILMGAILQSLVPSFMGTREAPLHSGYVQGEIYRKENNGISHLKCDGCRVELYENFILVFIDKSKQPTWTDNYVLPIPWDKVEHLTLAPPSQTD